ncbi:hypothetical protein F511_32869 [Dorcoceras hygrometricum]|uniref:Uncharacterized protein n=1 Tax=Dorcoceras hygrometricum TaxID=472368 RepID=A0A2Z7BI40_9LAMI|nr:hypothetical protein F511_32869 [Dorcoceras hygrometricum]
MCSALDLRKKRDIQTGTVVEDFKLAHQLGKTEEQFKRRIKKSSSAVNEAQNCSRADQVQRTRAVIECEARLARVDPKGRGRICMLGTRSVFIKSSWHTQEDQLGETAQMKNLLRYREQIRNQLVKDKSAG